MDLELLLDRPIAFHRVFVPLAGVAGAVFLSQALYWSKRTNNQEKWFYKTQEEWEEETGLTRYEQKTIREKLCKKKILEEKLEGLPAKLYFRVNLASLKEFLSGCEKNDKNHQSNDSTGSVTEPCTLDSDLITNKDAISQQTIYTETTTETTYKENNKKKNGEPSQKEETIPSLSDSSCNTRKNPCGHCSKCSLSPCTDLELWQIATDLDLRLKVVHEKHTAILEDIESGYFQRKYKHHKTLYYTLKKWLRMDVERRTIFPANEMEILERQSEHPDKVRRREEAFRRAREEGIID